MIRWEEWFPSLGLFRNYNWNTEFFLVQIRTRLYKIISEKKKETFFHVCLFFMNWYDNLHKKKKMTKNQLGFIMPRKTISREVGAWREPTQMGKGGARDTGQLSEVLACNQLSSPWFKQYYIGARWPWPPKLWNTPGCYEKVHFLYIGTQKTWKTPIVIGAFIF